MKERIKILIKSLMLFLVSFIIVSTIIALVFFIANKDPIRGDVDLKLTANYIDDIEAEKGELRFRAWKFTLSSVDEIVFRNIDLYYLDDQYEEVYLDGYDIYFNSENEDNHTWIELTADDYYSRIDDSIENPYKYYNVHASTERFSLEENELKQNAHLRFDGNSSIYFSPISYLYLTNCEQWFVHAPAQKIYAIKSEKNGNIVSSEENNTIIELKAFYIKSDDYNSIIIDSKSNDVELFELLNMSKVSDIQLNNPKKIEGKFSGDLIFNHEKNELNRTINKKKLYIETDLSNSIGENKVTAHNKEKYTDAYISAEFNSVSLECSCPVSEVQLSETSLFPSLKERFLSDSLLSIIITIADFTLSFIVYILGFHDKIVRNYSNNSGNNNQN